MPSSDAYELHEGGVIRRVADGVWIPPDPANADYQRFLALGGKARAVSAPQPEPAMKVEELVEVLVEKGILSVEDAARARGTRHSRGEAVLP